MGLADSILGANQASQYLEKIRQQRESRKQQSASSAAALLDLSKLANNESSIKNVEKLANKMLKDEEKNNILKSKVIKGNFLDKF